MDVLLIESTPGIATSLQQRLIRDGHEVISCNDSHNGPCRGVESNASCPMDQHIDVAVLARERGVAPTLNEMGSVCALRHRVPMVTLYPGDEFGPGASTEVAAAVARREVEAGYVAVIRREVGHAVEDITRAARAPTDPRHADDLDTVDVAQAIGMLADRARQAVREHDSHTPVVDVSVVLGDARDRLERARTHEYGERTDATESGSRRNGRRALRGVVDVSKDALLYAVGHRRRHRRD